jgi:hypothetical protein
MYEVAGNLYFFFNSMDVHCPGESSRGTETDEYYP